MNDEEKEKAKKKAEKAAKKARKAEKEAKKRDILKAEEEDGDKSKEEADDADDEDVVMYGAPDDHAWTDASAAMKDAEKKKKDDGPDLSVSSAL
jgi:nickel-dependent lactate racemase